MLAGRTTSGANIARLRAASLEIAVRLTPRAAADGIEGLEIDGGGRVMLQVRVRALPEANAANRALEALIADWLGVGKSNVSVERGGKSRLKLVVVEGDPATLAAKVEERLRAMGRGEQ